MEMPEMDLHIRPPSHGRSMHKPPRPPRLTPQLPSSISRCRSAQVLEIRVATHTAVHFIQDGMFSGSRLIVV